MKQKTKLVSHMKCKGSPEPSPLTTPLDCYHHNKRLQIKIQLYFQGGQPTKKAEKRVFPLVRGLIVEE